MQLLPVSSGGPAEPGKLRGKRPSVLAHGRDVLPAGPVGRVGGGGHLFFRGQKFVQALDLIRGGRPPGREARRAVPPTQLWAAWQAPPGQLLGGVDVAESPSSWSSPWPEVGGCRPHLQAWDPQPLKSVP